LEYELTYAEFEVRLNPKSFIGFFGLIHISKPTLILKLSQQTLSLVNLFSETYKLK